MNRPTNVLLVTKSTGGVADYIRQLVHGLQGSRYTFTVICLSENGPKFAIELGQIEGVKAFSLKMNRYKVDPISDLGVLFALARHLRTEKYDIIHAHASKPGFLTRFAAIGTATPVLYSPHCFAFHAGVGHYKARIIAVLEDFAARYFTTRIVLVSDGERELARSYGIGKDTLFVTVFNGIDPEKYSTSVEKIEIKKSLNIPANAALVCSVGRLCEQKSPLDFVHMAAILHKRKRDIHFIWVGGGPLMEAAQALQTELGLNEVLHFLGHRNDVKELLQASECFVLSSLWEGFATVLLEAMAAGTPVVATDILGNRDAIRSGVDGLLVPVKNPDALAQAVLEIVNNPELSLKFSNNARGRVVKEFNRQQMLDGLSSLYDSLTMESMIERV